MNLEFINQAARQEATVGTQLPHSGVQARVLGEVQIYPPITVEFEEAIRSQAKELLALLATESSEAAIAQRLAVLTKALGEARSGKLNSATAQDPTFKQLLPYNVEGVSASVGPEVFFRDLVVHYRTYALLTFVQQNLGGTPDAPTLSSLAVTLGRLTDDFEWVLGDVVSPTEEKSDQETLAAVAPTFSVEQLVQRIQGDYPNSDLIEEDLATLCAGFLCPLHYLPDLQPIVKLPGSVVWSRAALYNMFVNTSMRIEVAPLLAEAIVSYLKKNEAFQMADPLIHQLFTMGRKVLRDYYAKYPPQRSVAEALGLKPAPVTPGPGRATPATTGPTTPATPPVEDASWKALEAPSGASGQLPVASCQDSQASNLQPPTTPDAQPVQVTTPPKPRKVQPLDAA